MNTSKTLVTAEKDAALHGDVRGWQAEARLWLDEVDIWRKEHEAALRELAEFEQKFLHTFREKIDRHGDVLAAYDRGLEAHEHALSQHIQGNDVVPYGSLIDAHQRADDLHSQRREKHAKAKQHFATFMADMAAVRQALGQRK